MKECVYIRNMPFELQREDGFIKNPKLVVNALSIIFNYILYNKGCIRLKTYTFY